MIPIPDFLRAQAAKLGVAPNSVDALWADHVAHCDKHGKSYGGGMWRSLCERAAFEPRMPTIPRNDPEVLRLRRLEREAKLAEDQAYQAGAISFPEWVGTLMAAQDFHEPLTPPEEHLVEAGLPPRDANPVAWLVANVLERMPSERQQLCECGQPVMSWAQNGVRYHGATCEPCGKREAEERRERRAAGGQQP